jgi:uncharacterized protein YndB with AHSA1/START domain
MKRPSTLVAPGTVKLERLLPGPIERAWAFITESDKRARWLAAGDFDLRVGGRIELRFDNDKLSPDRPARAGGLHVSTGVITRLEPPHVLAHTWNSEKWQSEVTYELAQRGEQVQLTIVHRQLGKDFVLPVMGGWDVHTGILEDLLTGAPPRSFWSTHERLTQEYAKENTAAAE